MAAKQHSAEESTQSFEKIGVRPLLYYASVITLLIFIITFYPHYYNRINLFGSIFSYLPFFSSYIFTYLVLFVINFIVVILLYRDKAVNMEKFSDVKIFGIRPIFLINRTGVKFIDFIGLVVGILLTIYSFINPNLSISSPGFLLLTLSFLFAIISGSSKKWDLKRRKM